MDKFMGFALIAVTDSKNNLEENLKKTKNILGKSFELLLT